MRLSFEGFAWDRHPDRIAEEVTGGDRGALLLANEAKKLMDPYVPAADLILAQRVSTYVKDRHGIVEYLSPYAHYQYVGILYVSSKTGSSWSKGEYKVPADRHLEHDRFRHPLATSEWDKAMMASHSDDLVRAYQVYINRRAK